LDPALRAKRAFFACLGVSLGILVVVDAILGPAAFAVPAPPPSARPDPSAISMAPATVPSTAPSSASATASASAAPSASVAPAESAATEGSDAEAPIGVTAPPKYAGGKTNGVVATFEFEQANADLTALQTLAKQMHEDTVSEIVLEGHSDPSGNEYRNLSLSLDRANWAADRLVEYGINRMRIRTVGLGSARPVIDVGGDAGAINRRVEVRWVVRSADGGGR
jgi:outer membrane protein OmpA-like peptidoglycan-associated protein